MAYSYDKLTKIAKRQIEKYGGNVYLNVPIDGKINDGTGQETYNQIVIPTKGLVTGYSTEEVNEINILEGDKQVIISPEEGKPLVNNTITINEELYRILQVDEINPGVNQPVVYRLHTRSTSLAPDLDGFFTTLKGLEIGDIVIDPKSIYNDSLDWPQWIKVANDHHAQSITTLVERRPYYTYRWDSGEPLNGYWIDSDLYNYLTTRFLTKLSIEFNELLQEVLVETNTKWDNVKITCLSKEELDGTATADGSSGNQIDYFDSAVKRTAFGADSLLVKPYWTRSHVDTEEATYVTDYGVTATDDTTVIKTIRAMVFLQESQIVKLNDDGETYSLVY